MSSAAESTSWNPPLRPRLPALGDDMTIDNAYCGAGMIPVSTICPSALMSNLELQSYGSPALRPSRSPPPIGASLQEGQSVDKPSHPALSLSSV
ncbi:MAG: hypothetical protein R3B70_40355 [Polyangiaceae bacterium]